MTTESNLTTEVLQNGVNAASVEPTVTQAPEAPPLDPVEEAAMRFTTLLPYVKKFSQAMPSQKGLARVIHAFAEFPLGAEKPRLLTEGERQLFAILQEISGCKSTVIQDIMKKNMEKQVMEQELRRHADEQSKAAELPVAEVEKTNGEI